MSDLLGSYSGCVRVRTKHAGKDSWWFVRPVITPMSSSGGTPGPGLLIPVPGDGGFCSAPSISDQTDASSKPLYWKVTNPTLSPSHLQGQFYLVFIVSGQLQITREMLQITKADLLGFTRSVYERDHALITPESSGVARVTS
ncbi:hypothetical protein PTKIN_Ptkin05aG0022700 [Pterospermum kingtungense]